MNLLRLMQHQARSESMHVKGNEICKAGATMQDEDISRCIVQWRYHKTNDNALSHKMMFLGSSP